MTWPRTVVFVLATGWCTFALVRAAAQLTPDELAKLRAVYGPKQTAERVPAPSPRFTLSDRTLLGENMIVRVLSDHTQRVCALVIIRGDAFTTTPWPCDLVLK